MKAAAALEGARNAGAAPPLRRNWGADLAWRTPALQRRPLARGHRRSLRVYATIPAPESSPAVSELGWPVDFAQHYVKGKLIGQGSFGSVYMGIDLHTGKTVAVKVMPKQRGKLTRERTMQKLAKELGILSRMQACRNTVRLLGAFEAQDEVMVVTNLCNGGDLQKLSDDHGALPERAVALIAYEVLQVLEKCHELGILHGDVKPANFVLTHATRNPLFSKDVSLLFGDPWLLSIDFGCSQHLGPVRFSKRTGTPVYMSPEIFERDYSWEADMWSLGIMLYQLYARRFPYWPTYGECRHAKLDEVAALVADKPIETDYGPWLRMSSEGLDFVRRCLERDYGTRMTVAQALSHPWLEQWLPDDDELGGLGGLSLDSLATSSEDEGAGAAAVSGGGVIGGVERVLEVQQQLYEQQQAALARQVAAQEAAAQQAAQNMASGMPQQQQQQQQPHVVLQAGPSPQQHSSLQQQQPVLLQRPSLPQQQQQQPPPPPPLPPQHVLTSEQLQQQLAAGAAAGQHVVIDGGPGAYSSSTGSSGSAAAPAPAGNGDGTNNIVPGSRQQQQQQQQPLPPQPHIDSSAPQPGATAAVGTGRPRGGVQQQ